MEARTNRKLKQTKRSQGVSLGACVGVFGEITISLKRQETNATHDPGCWLLLGNQTIERTVTTRKNTFREIQLQAFCLRFGESFFTRESSSVSSRDWIVLFAVKVAL